MQTEHTQQLITVMREFGFTDLSMRSTHPKHPCVLWLQEDFANFVYLYKLDEAYFDEYVERYHKPTHGGFLKMVYDVAYQGWPSIREAYRARGRDKTGVTLAELKRDPVAYITCPPQALPEDVKRLNSKGSVAVVIRAYRDCYVIHKSKFARYNHSEVPQFMRRALQNHG